MIRHFTATLFLFSATGCASILAGKSQTITLQTNPPGARCELLREGRIVGTVETTPGAVTLNKTKHDINVVCKKEGYTDSSEHAKSGTEGSTFANILLGGGIGWAIDSAAGADNKYPDVVTINLAPAANLVLATEAEALQPAALPVNASKAAETARKVEETSQKLDMLKKMHSSGLLTDKEYENKKAELLRKL